MLRATVSASFVAALLAPPLCAGARADSDGLLTLRVGAQRFQVEVADTDPQRERGLMGRTSLPGDGGMLFVFERPGRPCFWMRNTPLPLSIAFIDAEGRVVMLADMQPYTDTMHCPARDVRYALEVAQGGFRKRGIGPGDQFQGLPP